MRLVLLLALPGLAIAASYAPLDGPPENVAQLAFADGQPVVAGTRRLSLADLDWLTLEDAVPTPASPGDAAHPHPGLWLTDGSWIPFSALAATTDDLVLATTPYGRHAVPLRLLSGWGATLPAPAADGLDRVVVASGPLDGRVRGLRDGKLLFASSLDPEPLTLDLGDILALRLAQPPVAPAGLSLLANVDSDHPPLRLRITSTTLVLAASGQPVHGLESLRLRVDGGRRVWLSALSPATVNEEGAFGVVWPWQRDVGLDGGPLVLGGKRYAKGIAVHSAARLTWDLGGAYLRLRALVGIADLVAPEGDCVAILRGDGKELWKQERVRGGEAPRALDLDLSGVQRLELEVGLGERFDIGDHLLLADAYLVRR
jgi:NPCBM/NEW2 domain